jgi:VanZ family protein
MRHLIFPILWTIIIGVLTGLPGNSFPNMSLWALLSFDSFAHFFVFAVFTFLWGVALCKQVGHPFLRRYGHYMAAGAGIIYGFLIEILQFLVYVGRSAEWADIIADTLGCLAGLILFRLIYSPVLREIGEE